MVLQHASLRIKVLLQYNLLLGKFVVKVFFGFIQCIFYENKCFDHRHLILTLKHKLLWVDEAHPSGHESGGAVVGGGGGVAPCTNCLQRNNVFCSQLKTSHNPAAVPVLMTTQPASLP